MIARALPAALALCIAHPAFAACDTPFMGCTFNGGAKTVSVCVTDEAATYRFGPTGGTPELTLESSIEEVDYSPWPGVGRTVFESVTFYNDPYSYTVIAGLDRFAEDDSRFSEVIVAQDGDEIAALTCDPQSVRWSYSPELADAKARKNLCWSGQADTGWVACD